MQIECPIRRVPVYLVANCSASMAGVPIDAVRQELQVLIREMQSDPIVLKTVWLSVGTFDAEVRQVLSRSSAGD